MGTETGEGSSKEAESHISSMGEVMAVAVLPVKRCCPTMTSPFSSRTHRWAQESATGMTTPRACTMPENTRTTGSS